jgi:hypothetical protein
MISKETLCPLTPIAAIHTHTARDGSDCDRGTEFTGFPSPDESAPSGRDRGAIPASPVTDDSRLPGVAILNLVEPFDRLRSASRRMSDPLEAFAQRVAERVIDLVVHVLDVNALVQRIDLNALLEKIDLDDYVLRKIDVNALLARVDVAAVLERADVNGVLRRVDVSALLGRVDVNELLRRVDMDSLVEQTDLGAVIAKSSGGAASEALDAARSQAVGLDQFIDRWVQRALRRRHAALVAPRALADGRAKP